jgi:hypothetical protein
MIRVQTVVLPILREALPGVAVVSVVPDVDYRTFPMVSIRRAGGTRNPNLPRLYSQPVLEMTAISADGPIEAEELYEDALEALYASARAQEARGVTTVSSPFPDTWAVEGSIRVGVRQRG